MTLCDKRCGRLAAMAECDNSPVSHVPHDWNKRATSRLLLSYLKNYFVYCSAQTCVCIVRSDTLYFSVHYLPLMIGANLQSRLNHSSLVTPISCLTWINIHYEVIHFYVEGNVISKHTLNLLLVKS